MDQVIVGSRSLGVSFRAHTPGQRSVHDLVVSVVAPGLSASGMVWDHPPAGGLAAFFTELARDWRGWRGERVFRFLDGDCSITATHDGHVRLVIELGSALHPEWTAVLVVMIDAGEQLSTAASEIAELLHG